jgi:Recombination endonuclease VII
MRHYFNSATHTYNRRQYNLKAKYGLTLQAWQELYDKQNGECAICHTRPLKASSLGVDYDPVKHKVFGLLCPKCRKLLGLARHLTGVMKQAITYLIEVRNEKVL